MPFRLTDGRTDRMPILMRLRVAVIRAADNRPFLYLCLTERTNASGRCFHAESFSQHNGRNGDPPAPRLTMRPAAAVESPK